MQIIDTTLVVPSGDPNGQPITIDLSQILIAEGRQGEVAIVTPMKAPELLALFNGAWRDLHKEVTKLVWERDRAEKEIERRKATVLLDEVPAILKAKGSASSTDTRKAVIDMDPEYIVRQDIYDQLNAAVEHLKGKLKSFENAYTSTKKLIGEDSHLNYTRNSNLSGGASAPADQKNSAPPWKVGVTKTDTNPVRSGWGTPKYNR